MLATFSCPASRAGGRTYPVLKQSCSHGSATGASGSCGTAPGHVLPPARYRLAVAPESMVACRGALRAPADRTAVAARCSSSPARTEVSLALLARAELRLAMSCRPAPYRLAVVPESMVACRGALRATAGRIAVATRSAEECVAAQNAANSHATAPPKQMNGRFH